MTDIIVSVQGISKQYRRGPAPSWQVRRSLSGLIFSPSRWFHRRSKQAMPVQSPETFWALKDISFELQRGERLGIIGRNGAGKSTLLKILSRVVYPTEGEARLRGRVASLLEIGTGFNGELTGRENIYLNATLHGMVRREIDKRLEEIHEFSGVGEFLDTPVKHYSSGMFTRLAFSVAAHIDPDILLLDEVLAVGDLSFQQKCLNRIEGLTSEGRTILFVSHSMESIARFCERCIWLDHGRIIKDGPTVEVVSAYVEEVLGVRSSQQWEPEEPESPPTLSLSLAPVSLPSNGVEDPVLPAPITTSPAQSGSSTSSAPGDEYVRLLAARVVDVQRRTVTSVCVDEPVGIEVKYEILKTGKNVQPALHFKTPQDAYAFVVAYTDPAQMRAMPEVGRYIATAWTPPHLLNAGVFYVTVVMATPDPMERHCVMERALSFHVHERLEANEETARGLYARDFPGAVRPKLTWETRRLGKARMSLQKGTDQVNFVSSETERQDLSHD